MLNVNQAAAHETTSGAGLTRPAVVALVIMSIAGIWLLTSWAFLSLRHHDGGILMVAFLTALQHGAEGALIGGVCDFIAVRSVYDKAQKGFDGLASNVSQIVVRDFLQLGKLLRKPDAMLRANLTPDDARELRVKIEALLPPKTKVRALAHEAWNEFLKPRAVQWLATTDLRAHLVGLETSQTSAIMRRKEVRDVAWRCVARIAEDEALARELAEAVNAAARTITFSEIGVPREPRRLAAILQAQWNGAPRERFHCWLADLDLRPELRGSDVSLMQNEAIRRALAQCIRATSEEMTWVKHAIALVKERGLKATVVSRFINLEGEIREGVTSAADAIEAGKGDSKLMGIITDFVRAYLDKWHSLSRREREKVTSAITDTIAAPLFDRIADSIAPQLADAKLSTVTESVVTARSVQTALRPIAESIRDEPKPSASAGRLYDALLAYVSAYLSAWHGLPKVVRQKAAGALVDAMVPNFVDSVVDVVWDNRGQLVAIDEVVRSEAFLRLIDHASLALANRADDLEAAAVKNLYEQITKRRPDEFVGMLKTHTKERLDWIKVNGTFYGFVIGAVLGGVMKLADHFAR